MERTYSEILIDLKKPFPPGTVQKKKETSRGSIPAQVYMARLEEVAAEQWHWRIVGEPLINIGEKYVMVKGELIIVSTVRQGLGVAALNSSDASTIRTALSTAETEAFRSACDKFLLGWVDLAPYREWSKNPGLQLQNPPNPNTSPSNNIAGLIEGVHSQPQPSLTGRKCVRCQKPLIGSDELALSMYQIANPYCAEHIPPQLLKNK